MRGSTVGTLTGTNHIGDKVRNIRKSMNLTQVEFAQVLGVSQGTISEIESFKTVPSSETIAAIQSVDKKLCLNWLFQQNENSENETAFFPPQCDKVHSDFTKPLNKSGYYVTTILNGNSIIAMAKLEQAAKDIISTLDENHSYRDDNSSNHDENS